MLTGMTITIGELDKIISVELGIPERKIHEWAHHELATEKIITAIQYLSALRALEESLNKSENPRRLEGENCFFTLEVIPDIEKISRNYAICRSPDFNFMKDHGQIQEIYQGRLIAGLKYFPLFRIGTRNAVAEIAAHGDYKGAIMDYDRKIGFVSSLGKSEFVVFDRKRSFPREPNHPCIILNRYRNP